MTQNHRAADLYQRMGFSIEGRRAQCLFVDGRFIDELIWPRSSPAKIPPIRRPEPPVGTRRKGQSADLDNALAAGQL
jgi:hypothetical protein